MRRWLPALVGLWSFATGCSTILGIEEIPEGSGDDGGSGSGGVGGAGGASGTGGGGTAGAWPGGSAGGSGVGLMVEIAGEAGSQGSVTSAPEGIDCPGTCSAQFEPGSSVTLTAAPAAGSRFTGWQGGGCSGTATTCNLTLDTPLTVTASFELSRNIAFVTSSTHVPGSIGSLAAADAICTARAQEAKLAGTYVAWLSTSTTNARSRLETSRGWIRPDGKPFADTVFDLIDGKIFYPLRITETGEDLKDTGGYVVTSSTSQGQLSGGACSDYTSATSTVLTGNPAATTGRWTQGVSTSCSTAMRIYCFGTDFQAPVSITPQSGRKLFVLPSWTPNAGGVADADAKCQSAASTAGLSGTFVALLATTTESAPSRLTATGENWVRPDGVPLAATAADFLSGELLTAPSQRANGAYVQAFVWTGASTWGNVGTTNCTNWTLGDSTVSGYRAEAEVSAPFMKNSTSTTCSSTARGLLCAEQ